MPLNPEFPTDPYEVIPPALRWYPGDADLTVEEAGKLIPPLVSQIREGVHGWRDAGYPGLSETSRALLNHWFSTKHLIDRGEEPATEFRYYFAQREAVETVVWLFECEQARDPYSLMRYDATGRVSTGFFDEHWTRYVSKLATGAGKTKVLSLLIAWSYFHKRYEEGSPLSTNFLLIVPNIIVLDRLRDDFDALRIFHDDPVLPENGYAGRNWRDDFQMTLHIQDEVGTVSSTGNLFLSNVHRIYEAPVAPSIDDEDVTDFFLGARPVANTTQKVFDLGAVVRSIDDLVVLNDEAHHVHDSTLAWFRAIQSIDAKMRQRTGHGISIQLDVTATPKTENGSVFVQTVSSYPLVEAIRQGVVKTPVVPDEVSRSKLTERASDNVAERYADHLKLGHAEWAKRRDDLVAAGKKPVLFIMTTDTSECDEVAAYMERTFEDLTGKVLVIHTKANGEINESKAKDEDLERLREASRSIDSNESPYLCVVSVLMLREGWDVQNVISMVGLRPYTAKAKVLPEQTLGRGLRRMFRGDPGLTEYVSVVGTEGFLDFVEEVRKEGVDLVRVPMGGTSEPMKPMLVEVDHLDPEKDVEELEISVPKLSNRIRREWKNLEDLDVASLAPGALPVREFSEEQQRVIRFRDLDKDDIVWTTDIGGDLIPTPQAAIAYLTRDLMGRLRLVGGQEILFGKLKEYIRDRLFVQRVDLEDPNVLQNLAEKEACFKLFETFARAINELTIVDSGTTAIQSEIKISKTRPRLVNNQDYVTSKRTLFNKVIGDSHLELRFAKLLDRLEGVRSFAKNSQSIHFSVEYVKSTGEISYYYPDFLVRTPNDTLFIVETKGLEDVDVSRKWARLVQWCDDANSQVDDGRSFVPLYVTEDFFDEVESYVKTMDRLASLARDRRPVGAG